MGAGPMGQPSMGQPPYGQPQPPYGGSGGSFLGTAAATAVGVIGSSLMLDGIRSMMGHRGGGAHAAVNPPSGGSSASPWSSSSDSSGGGGNLAREAGLDDIGRSSGGRDDGGRAHGFADSDPARASGEGRSTAEDEDTHHPDEGQDDRFVADSDEDDDIDLDDGDTDDGDFGGSDDQ
jgi:hypothetical protein